MISIELENFNIKQIMESGQCFRMDETDTDCFTVIAGKKYVEVRQKGQIVDFDCSQEDFLFFWIPYFDLDADYSRYIQSVNPRDRYLCAAAQHGQGIRILRQDLWEMLITFLISQQNNIRRIRRCIESFCRMAGNIMVFQSHRLWLPHLKKICGHAIWDTVPNMFIRPHLMWQTGRSIYQRFNQCLTKKHGKL